MKEFEVPIVMNIPIEKEQGINKEVNDEIAYENLKQNKIKKIYDNPLSKLRQVAE